jgi:hypothetical protein
MKAGVASNTSKVAATRVTTDDIEMRPELASNTTSVAVTGTSARNADPSKDQQNYEVGDEKSVRKSVKSRVAFSSGLSSDPKEQAKIGYAPCYDGDTDIDVVPEAMLKISVARQGRMQAFVQSINLSSFFQGTQYRIMSALFGPMPCFFTVA